MIIKKGKTDVITYFNLVDSTAGTPETGLTITNIDATYTRAQAAAVKNDLTALAAVTTAHTDNKGIEVDATNAPGLYRVDWPDAAFATGVDRVILTVTCSGCAPAHLIVELVDYDPQDTVRLGLTALPNAAADAAGGLVISDAGGFDVDNRAPAAAAVTNLNTVYSTDFAANYNTTLDTWNVNTTHGAGTAWNSGAIGAATLAADAITDAKVASDVTIASVTGAVGSVTGAVGSVTGNVGGNVTGSIGSLATQAKADVEAEVGDALAAYHVVMVKTTIATLASQTSFTLTAGSADNDAYNGCEIVIEDLATAAQKAVGVVEDYTGATKTVTLRTDPAVFTMAAGDVVTIRPSRSLKSTVDNRTLDVSPGGEAGLDWANVGTPSSTVNLSATTLNLINTLTTYTGNTPQTGDSFLRLTGTGAVTFASLTVSGATTLTGSLTATNASNNLTLGTFTVTTNAIAWNASWDAEVQSEVDDALIAKGLDHLVFTSVTGTDIADNSIIAMLVSKSATADWDSYVNTTDALEAIRDRGDLSWTTATGFSTLDAAGVRTAVGLASANLDTQLGDIPTNSELATAIITGLTTALTEGYRSANATGSVRDLLYEIIAHLGEASISATTKTLKKLDGSTTAKTYTINSSTVPTSITETT